MSIKVHFLFSHFYSLPESFGSVSDENVGRGDALMMADPFWNLICDCIDIKH